MQNRGTLLMIVIVLAVSVIALIAILVVSWSLIGGTIESGVNSIARAVQLQNLDYNFEIPQ